MIFFNSINYRMLSLKPTPTQWALETRRVVPSCRSQPRTCNKLAQPRRCVVRPFLPTPRRRRHSHSLVTRASTSVSVADPTRTKVGFVGLGIMGYPMALNLLKAGYSLTVWNRSSEKCDDLAAGGAAVANFPAEVTAACDITIAMLADPQACLEVTMGAKGAAAGMAPGKAYIDVSTVDAATSKRVAEAVRVQGGLFLEAPVSGSKAPAEQGQLVFLTAGDKAAFDAAAPLLEVMGKASFFLGDVGAGARMKLVVNQVMGSMMGALAEGLVLADAAGLEQNDVVEVLGLGAMACPMFALKGPAMAEGRYPTAFPLKHQQKDLRLSLELAEELGTRAPIAAAANAEFVAAMEQGLGDADFSAVLEALAVRRTT